MDSRRKSESVGESTGPIRWQVCTYINSLHWQFGCWWATIAFNGLDHQKGHRHAVPFSFGAYLVAAFPAVPMPLLGAAILRAPLLHFGAEPAQPSPDRSSSSKSTILIRCAQPGQHLLLLSLEPGLADAEDGSPSVRPLHSMGYASAICPGL